MMYHFFNIGTYYPQSTKVYSDMLSWMLKSTFEPSVTLVLRGTKVLLGYVVINVKIYIWAKWDLGTPGGKHLFLQIYTDFVPNWLNRPIIEWHSHAARYGSLIMEINTKDHVYFFKNTSYIMVTFSTQLVLKNTIAFYKRPQSTLGAFNYMCCPVEMTTSLSQCFIWIIESYTCVVVT